MARRRRRRRRRGGNYSQADVYDLVRSVGGSRREAQFLASVVPGESGGRLNVINSIGATGLFQIYNGNKGGERHLLGRPRAQAKAALGKLRSQGKGAWAASRHAWVPYHGSGTGRRSFGGGGGGVGRIPGGTLVTPGMSSLDLFRKQVFDQAGFEKAQRAAIVGSLIAKRKGTGGILFKTGLLTTEQPDPGDFTDTKLMSRIVNQPGSSRRLPGYTFGGGGGGGARGHTKVRLAPGADRAGVRTSHYLRRVLSGVAGIPGGITITTGSNHNRLTVNGNVSDHWGGRAADIAVPVDSRRGDLIAGRVLMRLGVSRRRARQMARRGGLFNVNYAGHRWQVIWKTNQGGNHHNHVHVGLA